LTRIAAGSKLRPPETGGCVPHTLAPHELACYRERGYFVREAVFDERALAPLRDAVERVQGAIAAAEARGEAPVERIDDKRYQRLLGSLVKWEWEEGSRAIRSMEPFVHLDARLDALVDDPRLVAVARDLVGGAVALFTDKLNFKRPGGSPFPWHQDTPYWAFGCAHTDRLASVQLYLDAATPENGCLWVIPGSHRAGILPSQQDGTVLGRLYTDVSRIGGAEEPVALAAPAGSAIWFDGAIVHGSRGNKSGESRRAIVLTYQPAGHPRWNRAEVRPAGAA
jgi:ectoine hydroxylase-related dioxygenase (phytanoyl-CoA dioxygenase family)